MILDVAPTDLVVYLLPEWTTPTMGPSTVQWDTDMSTPDCQTPQKNKQKKNVQVHSAAYAAQTGSIYLNLHTNVKIKGMVQMDSITFLPK